MIFGGSEDVSGIPASAEQKKMTGMMQGWWFAFCEDPWGGLMREGWPVWDEEGEFMMGGVGGWRWWGWRGGCES